MSDDAEFITSVLDRKNYPDLDATFGDDWTNVPEWGSTDKCEDVVKCMYTKKTFMSLLESVFDSITVWKPLRSTVFFARAQKRTSG